MKRLSLGVRSSRCFPRTGISFAFIQSVHYKTRKFLLVKFLRNCFKTPHTQKQSFFRTTRIVAQEIENLQRQHDERKKQHLVHGAPVNGSRSYPLPSTNGIRRVYRFGMGMNHTQPNTENEIQERQAPQGGGTSLAHFVVSCLKIVQRRTQLLQ